MNCPKCDTVVSFKKNQCDQCGQDLKVFKRVISASNIYYNDGLIRAKVRDLSGAIISLKKSLQLNKKNTNARNLLGLVYYEMGETVAALSEWVLSKHFQSEENIADEYVNSIQSNPNRLDTINQAIKKYNSALLSAKQGSGDLAIIQLKKVVSLNPRFIRAHQLLALLYMQTGEKEKAYKYLMKASKIDVNNTTTLRYISELGESAAAPVMSVEGNGERRVREELKSIIPVSSYKEDKPNIFAFINLVLGIIIGVAVVSFLVVPTIKKSVAHEYTQKYSDYSAEQATYTSKIESLQNDNSDLTDQVDKLQKQIDAFEKVDTDVELYDNLFVAAKYYLDKDKAKAAEALVKVKDGALENTAAKALYDIIQKDTFASVSDDLFVEGRNLYNAYKYDEALVALKQAFEMNPKNVDAIYFIGRTYHRLDDRENAITYYNMVIKDFPDSARVAEAKARLKELD